MNFREVDSHFNKIDKEYCYRVRKIRGSFGRQRRYRVPVVSWLAYDFTDVEEIGKYRLKGIVVCDLLEIGCSYRVALLQSTLSKLTFFSFSTSSHVLQEIVHNFYMTYIAKKLPFSDKQYIFVICFQPTEGCFLYYKSLCGSLDKENFYLVVRNFVFLYEEFLLDTVGKLFEIKTFSMLVFCIGNESDE